MSLSVFEESADNEDDVKRAVCRGLIEKAEVCPVCQVRARSIVHTPGESQEVVDVDCPACQQYQIRGRGYYDLFRDMPDKDADFNTDRVCLAGLLSAAGRPPFVIDSNWRHLVRESRR
jgi:hypothetical protein